MLNSQEITNYKNPSTSNNQTNIQQQNQLFLINSLLNNNTQQQQKTSSNKSLPSLTPQTTILSKKFIKTLQNFQTNNKNSLENANMFKQLWAQPNLFIPLVPQQQQIHAVAAIQLLQQQQQHQFKFLINASKFNTKFENAKFKNKCLNRHNNSRIFIKDNSSNNLFNQFKNVKIENFNNKLKWPNQLIQSAATTTEKISTNIKNNEAIDNPQSTTIEIIPWYNYITANQQRLQINNVMNPILNGKKFFLLL